MALPRPERERRRRLPEQGRVALFDCSERAWLNQMIGQQNPADDHGKIRDEHSGKLLAIANSSTAVGAFAVQGSDDGTADNRRRIVRN